MLVKLRLPKTTYIIKSPSFQWFMPEKTEPLTGNGTLPGEVEKVNQGKQSDLYYKLHGFKNHAMATTNPTVACITTSA